VAEANKKLIGHILFSPITLSGTKADMMCPMKSL
jgi:predicted N-acetyltransferase YhbS